MINAHRLVYNNLSSEDFDVIPGLSFGGDDGATTSFLGKEGVYTEHYDGHHTIHRAKYNEVFVPRFTLVKKDYSDFSEEENRRILSWLTVSEKPSWLEVYKDDSNVLTWKCFGNITSLEQYKLGNGRVVGYEFEMETTHPYAWSQKFIHPTVYATTAEINNNDETNDYLRVYGTESFTLTCNTDEYNKPIYPTVTVRFSGSDIYIPINTDPMKDSYVMIPNAIYFYNDGYYVNLPSEGKKVQLAANNPVTSSMDNTEIDKLASGYYYFAQDGVIAEIKDKVLRIVTEVGAAVKIENATTNTSTVIAGAAIGETIMLDGTNKVISAYTTINGALVQETKIMGNHFNWEWLSLKYGDNNISITGDCEVKIEWIEPRKVGDL